MRLARHASSLQGAARLQQQGGEHALLDNGKPVPDCGEDAYCIVSSSVSLLSCFGSAPSSEKITAQAPLCVPPVPKCIAPRAVRSTDL